MKPRKPLAAIAAALALVLGACSQATEGGSASSERATAAETGSASSATSAETGSASSESTAAAETSDVTSSGDTAAGKIKAYMAEGEDEVVRGLMSDYGLGEDAARDVTSTALDDTFALNDAMTGFAHASDCGNVTHAQQVQATVAAARDSFSEHSTQYASSGWPQAYAVFQARYQEGAGTYGPASFSSGRPAEVGVDHTLLDSCDVDDSLRDTLGGTGPDATGSDASTNEPTQAP